MIRLSKAAAEEILRLRSKTKDPGALFRIGVENGGCSGLSYTLTFDRTPHPHDQVYTSYDIQIVVDGQYLTHLNGLMLDYSEDLMGGAFRFDNPNAQHHCGCGISFQPTPAEIGVAT